MVSIYSYDFLAFIFLFLPKEQLPYFIAHCVITPKVIALLYQRKNTKNKTSNQKSLRERKN